jgi:hypothetical protein
MPCRAPARPPLLALLWRYPEALLPATRLPGRPAPVCSSAPLLPCLLRQAEANRSGGQAGALDTPTRDVHLARPTFMLGAKRPRRAAPRRSGNARPPCSGGFLGAAATRADIFVAASPPQTRKRRAGLHAAPLAAAGRCSQRRPARAGGPFLRGPVTPKMPGGAFRVRFWRKTARECTAETQPATKLQRTCSGGPTCSEPAANLQRTCSGPANLQRTCSEPAAKLQRNCSESCGSCGTPRGAGSLPVPREVPARLTRARAGTAHPGAAPKAVRSIFLATWARRASQGFLGAPGRRRGARTPSGPLAA